MSMIERNLQYVREQADADLIVTINSRFEVDRWVQFKGEYINAAYPFTDPPLDRLKALDIDLPLDVELDEWGAVEFVTCIHTFDDVPAIAAFVVAYMEKALSMRDDDDAVWTREE